MQKPRFLERIFCANVLSQGSEKTRRPEAITRSIVRNQQFSRNKQFSRTWKILIYRDKKVREAPKNLEFDDFVRSYRTSGFESGQAWSVLVVLGQNWSIVVRCDSSGSKLVDSGPIC